MKENRYSIGFSKKVLLGGQFPSFRFDFQRAFPRLNKMRYRAFARSLIQKGIGDNEMEDKVNLEKEMGKYAIDIGVAVEGELAQTRG